MTTLWHRLASEYVECEIHGQRIPIPYFISDGDRRFRWQSEGKGSLATLKQEIADFFAKEHLTPELMAPSTIKEKLEAARIGIDCSGYVYHLVDAYLRQTRGISASWYFRRLAGWRGTLEIWFKHWRRERRLSADTLTNALNTWPVPTAGDVKPGDLIRLTPTEWHGKHVALVTTITPTTITYTHSGYRTLETGPHFGAITILDPAKGLEAQKWHETTATGQPYNEVSYLPKTGDGVRRLKFL